MNHADFDPNLVDVNSEFQHALRLIEDERKSLYITGGAGTGKSTFVQYFRAKTDLKMVVLAPTGVAALAVGGQTIHSFFRFPRGILEPNDVQLLGDATVVRTLDVLVLDEASMISANLMDAIDKSLRLNRRSPTPFGGIQVVLVGDLYQLPPVVTQRDRPIFDEKYGGIYFFNAPVFKELHVGRLELSRTYRQTDMSFLGLLNSLRIGNSGPDILEPLNTRVCERVRLKDPDSYVTLTPYNTEAHRINMQRLEKLDAPLFEYQAKVSGKFKLDKSSDPTERTLRLKQGARVIMLSNDREKRWVNGTLGIVERLSEDEVIVRIGKSKWLVGPHIWEHVKHSYDRKTKRIIQEVDGAFRQFPVRLAWGLTIHKSQGQTLDRVYVDLSGGVFDHGQTYVALSRCRCLDNLALSRPIFETDVIVDKAVLQQSEILQPVRNSHLLDEEASAAPPLVPTEVRTDEAERHVPPERSQPTSESGQDTRFQEQGSPPTQDRGDPMAKPGVRKIKLTRRQLVWRASLTAFAVVFVLVSFTLLKNTIGKRDNSSAGYPVITAQQAASYYESTVDLTFVVGKIDKGKYGVYVMVFDSAYEQSSFQVQINGTEDPADPRLTEAGYVSGQSKTLYGVKVVKTTSHDRLIKPKVVLDIDNLH